MCRWFDSGSGHHFAGIAHLVERHLAKVEVASSSLVARSICNSHTGVWELQLQKFLWTFSEKPHIIEYSFGDIAKW